jgi:hypothetical protein
MQKNTRELILPYSIESVYNFMKDPKNYLGGVDGVKINNNSASFSVPGFGNIDAGITNLIENKKVVIYSKDINTSLEANLYSLEDNKTRIELVSKSSPNCGLIKSGMILLAIPKVLNTIVDNLKTIKI